MNRESSPSSSHLYNSAWAGEMAAALDLAARAAAMILSGAGTRAVREKQRADLVTDVDEAVEAMILRSLAASFPRDGRVAEESAAAAVTSGRRWVVDPVDGTANFVHGHPFVAVSIALVDDAGPAVGVVHAPFLGEVYHASRGGGAFLNGVPLRVSGVERLQSALLATGFPFKSGKGDLDAYMRLVGEAVRRSHDVRRAGSAALDLAFTAAGRTDAFFELGLAPWDLAAGMLLVSEAGGTAGGWPGDALGPLETGRILASNGRIHEELGALLREWDLAEGWQT